MGKEKGAEAPFSVLRPRNHLRGIVDAYGRSRWEALDFTGSVASSYEADYSVMQSLQQAKCFPGFGDLQVIARLRTFPS